MEALASFSSSLVSFGASASIFESSDCSRPLRLFFPFGRRAMRGLLVTCAAETVNTTPSPSPSPSPSLSPSGSLAPDELKAKEVKLWGGRFEERVTDVVERSTEAISLDKELYKHDIMGSRAHASCFYTSMLAKQGLMTVSERDSILEGLDEIERRITSGEFVWRSDREDVHMNIEAKLTDMIGEPAKKLHTARSRNDQVTTDFRLWCRDAIDAILQRIKHLQVALVTLSLKNNGLIVPGYTHLQRAQPVILKHLLLALSNSLNEMLIAYWILEMG